MYAPNMPYAGAAHKLAAKKKANTNPPKKETLEAQYIGCLLSVIRNAMGIRTADIGDFFGTKTYSSVMGTGLVSPLTMRTNKNCEKFEAIPKLAKLMKRKGFGDVLRAYQRGEDLNPALFDEGLCDIIRETAQCKVYSPYDLLKRRQEAVFTYFKVKPAPKRNPVEKAVPADLQEQLIPVEVTNIHAAVAQERLLQRKDMAKRWPDMSYIKRQDAIVKEVRSVLNCKTPVEDLWSVVAKGLAPHIAPKSTQSYIDVLHSALRAEAINAKDDKRPSTPLACRAYYLLRHDS